jgi:hypothetical protein
MSKMLELNNLWKDKGASGHGQELPSGVRESSYIENPDAHNDVRTRVGYIVEMQASVDFVLVAELDESCCYMCRWLFRELTVA